MIIPNMYIGTSGWSFQEWVGSFYPEDMQRGKFLEYYSQHFQAVEIVSTMYELPTPDRIKSWRARVPDTFMFSMLAPKIITHEKMLVDVGADLNIFLKRAELLQEKLGVIVFQFPYNFKIDSFPAMSDFIESLPSGFSYAVDVGHPGWMRKMFFDVLSEKRVALALTDTPWAVKSQAVAVPLVYIRWRGEKKLPNERKPTPREEKNRIPVIQKWARKVSGFISQKYIVFGFFGNCYDWNAPERAQTFLSYFKSPRI